MQRGLLSGIYHRTIIFQNEELWPVQGFVLTDMDTREVSSRGAITLFQETSQ